MPPFLNKISVCWIVFIFEVFRFQLVFFPLSDYGKWNQKHYHKYVLYELTEKCKRHSDWAKVTSPPKKRKFMTGKGKSSLLSSTCVLPWASRYSWLSLACVTGSFGARVVEIVVFWPYNLLHWYEFTSLKFPNKASYTSQFVDKRLLFLHKLVR